jgi:hypothetical protein
MPDRTGRPIWDLNAAKKLVQESLVAVTDENKRQTKMLDTLKGANQHLEAQTAGLSQKNETLLAKNSGIKSEKRKVAEERGGSREQAFYLRGEAVLS